MTQPNQDSMAQLLRDLDLRSNGADSFHAEVEQGEGRLFGGLVLAQSVMAAGRTTDIGPIHSMHAYFLRAGKPAVPIDYGVERVREGKNFQTRRVTAVQAGDIIFEASVGFTRPEEGIGHQQPMPAAPDPESLPIWWETLQRSPEFAAQVPEEMRERMRRRGGRHRHGWANPIDIRACESGPVPRPSERLPKRMVWGRPTGPLPEDPLIHAALMVYFSDSGMVSTVASAYGAWGPGGATASLDHAMYWHNPPRFDDWLLYDTESPVGRAARALTIGSMYNRDGVLVASVVQEALFRGAGAGR